MRKIYLVSSNIIQFLALISTGILFLGAFLFTCYADDMTTQKVLTRPDNPLGNLLGMGLLLLVLWLCGQMSARFGSKWQKKLLALVMGWILVAGILLVLLGRTAPAADAWSVYDAAKTLAAGDTSVIHPTASYLSYYPQQIGLIAFWEPVIRFWNLLPVGLEAYHFIKLIYVLLVCVIVWFQYRTVELLWKSDTVCCFYLILAGANLPLIMYSSFVYSEIPSFAAMAAGIFWFLQSITPCTAAEGSAPATADSNAAYKKYLFFSLIALTLAVMLRKNSLILIIAIVLVALWEGLVRKSKRLLAYAVLCILLSVSILPLVQKVYELRAGSTLQSGVPAMSYFAMGMQESSRANGWYNGYNFNTYQENDMDTAATVQASRDYIAERSAFFAAHPDYAAAFYFNKFLSQWTDGTYASRQATLATLGERHPFVKEIYDGRYSPLYIGFCNIYQNILYLGCFLCFLKKLLRKDTGAMFFYLGFIGVFGGFLFHMIWEANARYIFLYGLLLLPYAAGGLGAFTEWFNNTFFPAGNRKNNTDRTQDAR